MADVLLSTGLEVGILYQEGEREHVHRFSLDTPLLRFFPFFLSKVEEQMRPFLQFEEIRHEVRAAYGTLLSIPWEDDMPMREFVQPEEKRLGTLLKDFLDREPYGLEALLHPEGVELTGFWDDEGMHLQAEAVFTLPSLSVEKDGMPRLSILLPPVESETVGATLILPLPHGTLVYDTTDENGAVAYFAYGKREQGAAAELSFENGGVFITPMGDTRLSRLAMKTLKHELRMVEHALLETRDVEKVYQAVWESLES